MHLKLSSVRWRPSCPGEMSSCYGYIASHDNTISPESACWLLMTRLRFSARTLTTIMLCTGWVHYERWNAMTVHWNTRDSYTDIGNISTVFISKFTFSFFGSLLWHNAINQWINIQYQWSFCIHWFRLSPLSQSLLTSTSFKDNLKSMTDYKLIVVQ